MKHLMMTAAVFALAAPAFAQTATDPATETPAPEMQTTTPEGTTPDGTATTTTVDPVTGQPSTTTTAPADATTDTPVTPGSPVTTDPTAPVVTDPAVTDPAVAPATPADTTTVLPVEEARVTLDQPGVSASWLTSRSIWTTHQPSTTDWVDVTTTERPAEWEQIADVSDLILTDDGQLVGYTADIGGFLGLGGRTVLLDRSALHVVRFGDDAYLVTNYSREELEAMPEFDTNMVHE